MTGLLTAFFAQLAIVSYRAYATGEAAQNPLPLPLPSDYTAPILVYGALSLVPGEGQRVAGMVGWGFVLATFLNLWDPKTGKIAVSKTNAPAADSGGIGGSRAPSVQTGTPIARVQAQ